ncbi:MULTISPECIES: hypothetical protein [Streptomyces]|uniref:hypothetical protein n=1 Tax=Streptomyces TaxID=1883 RepID=UPI000F776D45|nr:MULTISPECIES: hypothetical protein [Streptomyces]RST04811.1 hypothetical protein EF910_15040 [Streptomyces sp. WAC07149]GLX21996.1 hypothetical protein Slala01_56400 [Streptomyces lavendulae subsp. lavendulae]GLX29704.1 hypothetical protein Slala02_55240 [Streptomyces lavendulae subsp. lavendulae]
MPITPIPVLRGGKRTDLRAAEGELVLRRAGREHRIPFEAVALVHAERRAVEVRLRAPEGRAPDVYRIEGVSAVAATAFARAVHSALPPIPEGAAAVDGAALVTARPAEREPRTPREELGRRVKWMAWTSLLAVAVMSVVVSFATHPVMMIFVWLTGGVGFPFAAAVVLLLPKAAERWRLPRHGITVTAEYAHSAAEPTLYLYGDLEGYTRTFYDASGRLRLEVSYDPQDPGRVVRADGKGRWLEAVLLSSASAIAALALAAFLATPFMSA